MSNKCESCLRGFNGRHGNGYSPCACKKIAVMGTKQSSVKSLTTALCHALSNPPKKP